jgi:hypothetical protein
MPARVAHIVATCAIVTAGALMAQRAPPSIAGIYSNMHYIQAAGDVVGTEIIISPTKRGYEVTYQNAEGTPGPVYRVRLTVNGDSITFQLPPDTLSMMEGSKQVGTQLQPHPRFRARIMRGYLRGRFDGAPKNEILPRRARSYWRN